MKYIINVKNKLIIRYFQGSQDLDVLYSSIEESTRDQDYDPSYDGLFDLRDTYFNIDKASIETFVGKIQRDKKFHIKKKLVFLTCNPNQVVFSMLNKKFIGIGLYDIQVYSTIDTALIYLNIDASEFNKIEQILNQLKSLD